MRTKNGNTVVVLMMVSIGSAVAEPPSYKLQVIDPVVEQSAVAVNLANKRLIAGYSEPEYFPTWNNGDSKINAINNTGELVGGADIRLYHNRYEWHAFKSARGVLHDLGTLGGTRSEAYDINKFGDVAGGADNDHGHHHAFLYQAKSEQLLDLGSFDNDYHYAVATGLNDVGAVVGWSIAFDATPHGFVWTEQTGLCDLTGAGALLQSGATAINNQQQIVGWVRNGWSQKSQAVLWHSGQLYRLADCLINNQNDFALLEACDINDRGQIVGRGCYEGETRCQFFFLTPVKK